MFILKIYSYFKNLLTKEWPEHRQSHHVIGCSIGVYNFIFHKTSVKKFYLPNIPDLRESLTPGVLFVVNRLECFIENKNKIRTLWDCKIELRQSFTCSYKKECSDGGRKYCFWFEKSQAILQVLSHVLVCLCFRCKQFFLI